MRWSAGTRATRPSTSRVTRTRPSLTLSTVEDWLGVHVELCAQDFQLHRRRVDHHPFARGLAADAGGQASLSKVQFLLRSFRDRQHR